MCLAYSWGSGNRRRVRAAWEAQHFDRTTAGFQHGIELFGLLGRTTIVGFALDEQGRRGAAVGIGDRRAALVDFGDLMRASAQFLDREPRANVAHTIEADPVGNRILWHSRLETVGLPDNPARQVAAAGKATHA